MDKISYLHAALKALCFIERSWITCAFAIVHEGPDDWKKDPYPYRIVATPTGYSYVAEDKISLLPITDAKGGEPLLDRKTKLTITPEHAPNLKEASVETSIGRLLYNWVMVIYPFGNKLRYYNELGASVEKIIDDFLPLWVDAPADGTAIAEGAVTTEEYLKFCEAGDYLRGFSLLWVPGVTEKAITPPAGLAEYKAELLAKYDGQLHEPTIIAIINDLLVKFDAKNLAGDNSEGFLISDKARNIVRRKLYLMTGAEPGLEDKVDLDLIKNSLSEGWEISKFPAMIDTVRSGAFQRGAETMYGGEAVKWLMRASSNLAINGEDCGSKLGMPTTLTKDNIAHYRHFHAIVGEELVLIEEASVDKLVGAGEVLIRSPQFCQATLTDYCVVCAGPRLTVNKTGLSAAVTGQGSKLMLLAMGGAHAKALLLSRMDYKSAIT